MRINASIISGQIGMSSDFDFRVQAFILALSGTRIFANGGNKPLPTLKLHPNLVRMVDAYIASPVFKDLSKYWSWLNIKNIQQLNDFGYENFKQTIARNYFTWVEELGGSYLT